MHARILLLVGLLALWPGVGHAEEGTPTPASVAAAMLPCLTNDGRLPVEIRATVVGAEFWEYPEHTMRSQGALVATLHHAAPSPSARAAGMMFYEGDDPAFSPVRLDMQTSVYYTRLRYVGCFYLAYHP